MNHESDITKAIPPTNLPRGITIFAQKFHSGAYELRDVVGSLEKLEKNQYIKIKRRDTSDGSYIWIPSIWIEKIDEEGVHLSKTIDEVKGGMLEAQPLR